MATKKELETKRELAKLYYMNGDHQKMIAGKVGISEVTLSKWVTKEGWEAKRAGANITRPELINKLLLSINTIIEKASESGDPAAFASMSDKLSKIAATIEKLDKKASVVDTIDVFIAFGKWLEARMCSDGEITAELLKKVTRYQDGYISEQFNANTTKQS
jgi:transposase-like protein